jgi:hypothetical protein
MYRKIMMALCIGMMVLGLASTGYSEPSSNVAFGKTVAGKGEFFTGGFGALQVVDFSTLTDGVFFPPGQNWTEGTVWWDEFMDSIQNFLIVYLGDTYRVRKIVTQLDSNDNYVVSWNDLILGPQQITVVAPSTPGGLTPPIEINVDAITDAFRIEADVGGRGDGYYSISEFQAYSGSIVIGNCDTGVADRVLGDNSTISDRIAECAESARNHGKFVSCVAHLTNDLKTTGIINGKEKGKIQSCAAQADIP